MRKKQKETYFFKIVSVLSLKVRVVLNRHSDRFLTLVVIDTSNLKTKPSVDQAQIKLNKEIIILLKLGSLVILLYFVSL